ncbi:hypothetical protein G3578_17885 [Brevibacillus sp. SYP-B805]|uniref:TadE/TadG family type IV pilus assembly protein n=1 Tax=Brevibacillus sp. SYP-B805 TaxID=1578199 RepID=UPI0013ED0839|nr:pilus assembly protein TadG-related protein [Brevibacillus sp. SYP-B805]NGQ97036.1 hypothetical protein [Brevibacillus sp. SYP-B805]
MKQMIRRLSDERGNMLIFVLSIFTFILLVLFTALFNFSTVFVAKEQAANCAQQASLAATKDIYEAMEDAIIRYDTSPARLLDPVFITPDLEREERELKKNHPDWASVEIRYTAIDHVLSAWLPGNAELQGYVRDGLSRAQGQIVDVVSTILEENHATLEGSSIQLFNRDDRIEVNTSVRFTTEPLGFDFIPRDSAQVYQTGQSRRIGFLDEVVGWSSHTIPL